MSKSIQLVIGLSIIGLVLIAWTIEYRLMDKVAYFQHEQAKFKTMRAL